MNLSVKVRPLHASAPHSFLCGDLPRAPERNHLVPVVGEDGGRPAKVFPLGFRGGDALTLTLANGQAFLLGNRSENFNQDIVHHLENPFLTGRQVHHGGWQVDYFEADAVAFEPLEFIVNVGLAAAESVERLNNQCVARSQHSSLERLIAGAVKVFAGLLIRDEFSVIRAERAKGFELTIEVLFACGNASVVKSFVHRFISKNVRKDFTLSGHFRLLQLDLVGHLVVVDDVGEQADNGQRTENDFSCVHKITFFP